MKDVELIQVIRTRLTTRGDGKTDKTILRAITQYWSLDGELLAEVDPFPPGCASPRAEEQQP